MARMDWTCELSEDEAKSLGYVEGQKIFVPTRTKGGGIDEGRVVSLPYTVKIVKNGQESLRAGVQT